VREKGVVELEQAAFRILVLRRVKFAQYERMAAYRALAEDDEATGKDISALDRDRYRRCHIAAAEIIARAHHDAFPAVDVHGVVGNLPAEFGTVIFEDRRRYCRLLTLVDSARGHRDSGVHDVGVTRDASQRLADTFEL